MEPVFSPVPRFKSFRKGRYIKTSNAKAPTPMNNIQYTNQGIHCCFVFWLTKWICEILESSKIKASSKRFYVYVVHLFDRCFRKCSTFFDRNHFYCKFLCGKRNILSKSKKALIGVELFVKYLRYLITNHLLSHR